jgi:hypothetical protein
VNTYIEGKTEILKTFSVKGFKTWRGREGVGAQATVYKDGKQIGWVTDEGNGGEVSLRATGEDERMIKDFLDTLPKYKFSDYWQERYGEDWDGEEKSELKSWVVHTFADVMLDRAEEATIAKANAKGGAR